MWYKQYVVIYLSFLLATSIQTRLHLRLSELSFSLRRLESGMELCPTISLPDVFKLLTVLWCTFMSFSKS